MTPEQTTLIATVASCVAAIASIATASSVFLLWKRMKASHERARRERTLELLIFFTKETNYSDSGISPVRAFVESLDRNQCDSLQNKESFLISANLREVYSECILSFGYDPGSYITTENVDIEVPRDIVKVIRFRLIHYLNVLETIATAWRHYIGDREILEEEFKSIISRKKNTFVLEDFRNATNIFPSLEVFVQALKDKGKNTRGKDRVA